MQPTADWLTEDGARALARKITQYWIAKGVAITTTIAVTENPQKSRHPLFCVRSNLHEVRK